MPELNWIAAVVLVGLFLIFKLELIASLLNIKAFPDRVPQLLEDVMDEEVLAKARQYLLANTRVRWIQSAVSLGLLLAFWFFGGFSWLDGLARSLAAPPVVAGLIFLGVVVLAQMLIQLPFEYYHTFVIEERFGFNRSTRALFFQDQVKGLALSAALGLPLAAAVLWIFSKVDHAWVWAWLIFTGFQLLLTYLAPTYLMPLFNQFTPMKEGPLKDEISALGSHCGFPLQEVYVIDGSKRSSKANAFFTGIGKHKRIALYDTLIEAHDPKGLLAVLAHEIGHFKCGHIRQRLAVGIFQSAVMFFLLGLVTNPDGSFARTLFDAFGVAEISAHVGIVLFAILLSLVSVILGILANAWSRRHEYEADAYAAKMTGHAEALGNSLKKLSTDQLAHPNPARLRVVLDYSHPPLIARLAALAQRDLEGAGEVPAAAQHRA